MDDTNPGVRWVLRKTLTFSDVLAHFGAINDARESDEDA